jgi:hypothetical protein
MRGVAQLPPLETTTMRPHGIMKQMNEYANVLGELYRQTPKAVLAAVVVSLLSNGGDEFEQVSGRFLAEWHTLHDNGIVPQPPAKPK